MTDFDLTYAKQQILNKSDDELVIIANSTSDAYRQEVIDYAKEELQKRGAVNISPEKAQEIIEQREEHFKELIGEKEKGLPIRWLRFYIYFRLPFGLLLGFIQIFIMPDLAERVITLILTVPFAIFGALVFVGLHKRRSWGWKLNWVLLVLDTLFITFQMGELSVFLGVIAALIWLLPNYVYFNKRRLLFS